MTGTCWIRAWRCAWPSLRELLGTHAHAQRAAVTHGRQRFAFTTLRQSAWLIGRSAGPYVIRTLGPSPRAAREERSTMPTSPARSKLAVACRDAKSSEKAMQDRGIRGGVSITLPVPWLS